MRIVTKDIQARFELGEDEIAFWNGLSAAEQDAFHDQAVYELRDAIAQENFNGKLGIRGVHGKGSALAEAVQRAYEASPEYKAQREETRRKQREARDNAEHECYECHRVVPFKYALVAGEAALCFDCARQGPLAHLVPASYG